MQFWLGCPYNKHEQTLCKQTFVMLYITQTCASVTIEMFGEKKIVAVSTIYL